MQLLLPWFLNAGVKKQMQFDENSSQWDSRPSRTLRETAKQ